MKNLDWLKSISAKVEGRNVTIVAGLGFCCFGLWNFNKSYTVHPLPSLVFTSGFFLLGIAIVLLGLLARPQPSEVTQRHFIRQIGDHDFMFVSGMQSQKELAALLRTAHNIQELPPPVGLVRGGAADESSHEALSPSEAANIANKDHEAMEENLNREASRLLATFGPAILPSQSMAQMTGADASGSGATNKAPETTTERTKPEQ